MFFFYQISSQEKKAHDNWVSYFQTTYISSIPVISSFIVSDIIFILFLSSVL